MISHQVTVNLHKPLEDVFRFVATDYFTNHPRWDPRVVNLRVQTPGPIAVGSRGTEDRKQGGRTVPYDFEVTEYTPNRSLSLRARGGPAKYSATYSVSPLNGSDTQLAIRFVLEMSGLFRLMEPFMASSFRQELDSVAASIKSLMEAS